MPSSEKCQQIHHVMSGCAEVSIKIIGCEFNVGKLANLGSRCTPKTDHHVHNDARDSVNALTQNEATWRFIS
jgi:hypothetical protein